MGQVTFRFHGRFLHVQHLTDTLQPAKISVVAPRFPANAMGVHQPLMSINHRDVVFQGGNPKSAVTTRNPSFRVLTDRSDDDAQLLVWDLTGLTVRYRGSGTSQVGLEAAVPNLAALEDNENRSAALKVEALDPGQEILSNAVIEMFAEGSGIAKSSARYKFSQEDKAKEGVPTPVLKKGTKTDLESSPPELVDFSVDVPPIGDQWIVLEFFNGPGNPVGQIGVRANRTVCFSNNCPTLHETPETDLEFSRYYDLLAKHDPEALIPFLPQPARLTEGVPCYLQSGIQVTSLRSGGSLLKAIPHPVPKSRPTARPAARRAGRGRRARARG